MIALLAAGAALALLLGAIYGLLAVAPETVTGASSGFDEGQLRLTSAGLALAGAAFCALQAVAVVGLLGRKSWARVPATVACVAWALTCVGAPFALLALNALWRPRTS